LAAGEEDRMEHVNRGMPREKIMITGLPSHDQLYRARRQSSELRASLTSQYNLDPARKMVVCALPYHAKQHHPRWESYWGEVEFLVATLAGTGANVLLSLHPKTEPKSCLGLESKFGVHVLRQPMNEILPVADLLVASFSSTVRWAVLMGIPVLVFDFYRQRFNTYQNFEGVITVMEKADLPPQLHRLLDDEDYYRKICQGQMKAAARMANFDGESTQRIVKLLSSYCYSSGD
jgi:UDP-N-acetylglucosamine 2-epimerase